MGSPIMGFTLFPKPGADGIWRAVCCAGPWGYHLQDSEKPKGHRAPHPRGGMNFLLPPLSGQSLSPEYKPQPHNCQRNEAPGYVS